MAGLPHHEEPNRQSEASSSVLFGKEGSKRIWLIGIKGAGMWGLAKLLIAIGCEVGGSDVREEFAFTGEPGELPLVVKGFSELNIDRTLDIVVYSTAWSTSPELARAKELGLRIFSYPEALWGAVRNKRVTAVCGCHGKTTTTGILGHVLSKAGFDPILLGGAPYPSLGSSAIYGKGLYAVIEADEHQDKLKHYHPFAVVITNLGYDHPDYFLNEDHYFRVFADFVRRVPNDGFIIANTDDPNVRRLAESCAARFISFGFESKTSDWYAKALGKRAGSADMQIFRNGEELGICESDLMGQMNRYNVLAGVACATELGVSPDIAIHSIAEFRAPKRRLEHIGSSSSGAQIWDDFASNPTEVTAVIHAIRERFEHARITTIIQVHSVARLRAFVIQFAESLLAADATIITSTYIPRRERNTPAVGEEELCSMIQRNRGHARLLRHWDDIIGVTTRECGPNDIVITLGGGDIWKLARRLAQSR